MLRPFVRADRNVQTSHFAADSKIWVCANEQFDASNHDVIERIGSYLLSIFDPESVYVVEHQQIIEWLPLSGDWRHRCSPSRSAPERNPDRPRA
jgi:hypothetical protein